MFAGVGVVFFVVSDAAKRRSGIQMHPLDSGLAHFAPE
jgi:hypothetical protein